MTDFSRDIPKWKIRLSVFYLIGFSVLILTSIAASLFPLYFVYIVVGLVFYYFVSKLGFDVLAVFYKHFYILAILFLLLPLLIGQVTRGAVRWIPLGPLTLQPAEIVRPFLLIFFATYFAKNPIKLKTFLNSLGYLLIPVALILVQPSLSVALITMIGFLGIFLASGYNKKYIATTSAFSLLLLPLSWFLLQPYQKLRILTFLNPASDPLGAGYNSIQSMIAIGAGGIFGRGLEKGVQTQLAFLPERHSDFVFASVSEELGFVGAFLLILGLFFLLSQIAAVIERAQSPVARTFIAGVFLSLFTQSIVNMGMNLGLLPVTGLPLPLISAGGSSLIATLIMLGIVEGSIKKRL